jgi:hypothetical protein
MSGSSAMPITPKTVVEVNAAIQNIPLPEVRVQALHGTGAVRRPE